MNASAVTRQEHENTAERSIVESHQLTYFQDYLKAPQLGRSPLHEIIRIPPDPEDVKDAMKLLVRKPFFDVEQRNLRGSLRILFPADLLRFCLPSGQHVEILYRLYAQAVNGYRLRNPLTRDGQFFLHNAGNVGYSLTEGTDFTSTMSIIKGLSGLGKSSAIYAAVRVLGYQVNRHCKELSYFGIKRQTYMVGGVEKEKCFTDTQILYLKVNIPARATLRAVVLRCCEVVDECLGVGFNAKPIRRRSDMSRDDYLSVLRQLIATYHIGILILDEFQNVTLVGTTGIKELNALLVNLRDELGIPIVVVGTSKAQKVYDDLEASLATARRYCEGFSIELTQPQSPDDETFLSLCKTAWEFSWVRDPIEFDSSIAEVLYACSRGITGIMLCLQAAAQMRAIESGTEKVDADLLLKVYDKDFGPIHPCIKALKEGTYESLRKYDDMYAKAFKELKATTLINQLNQLREQIVEAEESRKISVEKREKTSGKSRAKGREQVERPVCVFPAAKLPDELA